MNISRRKSVLKTPWFDLVAKSLDGSAQEPYYALEMSDYVSVVALTADSRFVLVRQYRPAVEDYTLELPSGHVDPGEGPEEAARRELREETGFDAGVLERLEVFWPDTGRMANRMWAFLALDVKPCPGPHRPEQGLEAVLVSGREFREHIRTARFNHALNFASVFMACLKRPVVRTLLLDGHETH